MRVGIPGRHHRNTQKPRRISHKEQILDLARSAGDKPHSADPLYSSLIRSVNQRSHKYDQEFANAVLEIRSDWFAPRVKIPAAKSPRAKIEKIRKPKVIREPKPPRVTRRDRLLDLARSALISPNRIIHCGSVYRRAIQHIILS
jgi:hypothetical protein